MTDDASPIGSDPDMATLEGLTPEVVAAIADRVALKDRVLVAAFGHAAFDGWTRKMLHAAAETAGISVGDAARLFPQGPASLLAWADDWADRQMLAAVPPAQLAGMKLRAKVAALIRGRLEALSPHREAIRRAIPARTLTGDVGSAARGFARTLDVIWEAAGLPWETDDKVARVTRRISLGGVLSSVTLFWLNDGSEHHAASWAFLDRRLDDVMRLGRLTGKLRGRFGFATAG